LTLAGAQTPDQTLRKRCPPIVVRTPSRTARVTMIVRAAAIDELRRQVRGGIVGPREPHNVFCLDHNIDPDASVGREDR
jgi:hypothetical protein